MHVSGISYIQIYSYIYYVRGAVCCGMLQCVAVCCSVLQCIAVRANELWSVTSSHGLYEFQTYRVRDSYSPWLNIQFVTHMLAPRRATDYMSHEPYMCCDIEPQTI